MERSDVLIEMVKERKRKREAELLIKALPPEFIEELKREVKKELLEELLQKIKQQVRVGGGGGGGKTTSFADLLDTIADAQTPNTLLLDGSRAMAGNLNLGAYKFLTTNYLLKEYGYGFAVRNLADTGFENMYCNRFIGNYFTPLTGNLYLQTGASVLDHFMIRTYNGAALVTNMDCYEGKTLMPNLPVADPHVVGELWNNGGVVTLSAG